MTVYSKNVKISHTPTDKLSRYGIRQLKPGDKIKLERIFHADLEIARTRIPLLYKTKRISASLGKLRMVLGITKKTQNEDFVEMIKSQYIGVYQNSIWFDGLMPEQAALLTKIVIQELADLELPSIFIENYITALLYNVKIRPEIMPGYFLNNVLELTTLRPRGISEVEATSLTTASKSYIKRIFKRKYKINPKGKQTAEMKYYMNKLDKELLTKPTHQVRRLRNTKTMIAVLHKKSQIKENNEVKGYVFQTEATDMQTVTELYPDDLDAISDRRHLQTLRKTRERVKKRFKIK